MASKEQLSLLAKQMTYNKIPPWHLAGIKGQGIVALNFETPRLTKKHCESCTDRFKHAAPYTEVLEVGISEDAPGAYVPVCTHYKVGQRIPVEDVIRETGARIGIRSTGGTLDDQDAMAFWSRMEEEYGFILVTVPGMNNGDSPGGAFPAAVSIHVGACSLSDKGTITQPSYTLDSPYIKFVNFMGYLQGMSFAAPYTAGMIALLLQKWPWFKREDVIAYFTEHRVDIGKPGFENRSGWGVPIMGDPNEVKVAPTITTKLQITAELSETDVKKHPGGEIRRVRRILYGNENWFRLRDFEDILGLVDVEYDAANKLPTVED